MLDKNGKLNIFKVNYKDIKTTDDVILMSLLRVLNILLKRNIHFSHKKAFCQKLKCIFRSSPWEVFFRKGVLKIFSKFTGEYPCRSAVSIKLLCNFIEIALRHGCSPVNLLYIFLTPFPRNTSGWLLLTFDD